MHYWDWTTDPRAASHKLAAFESSEDAETGQQPHQDLARSRRPRGQRPCTRRPRRRRQLHPGPVYMPMGAERMDAARRQQSMERTLR